MSNVLQFKKKTAINEYYYTLQATRLEDGSVWWRYKCLNNGEYGEWSKLNEAV